MKPLSALLCISVALTLAACGGGTETVANDPPPPSPVDTIAPTVPNNLSASRTNATTVALTWTASTDTGGSGLAGYHVFRNGTQVTSTVVNTSSYTDTGAGATANSYQVRAIDVALNQSALSAPVNAPAAADTTPPSVPGGLTATAAGANQVNLSWTASTDTGGSGLAGYQVFRNGANITATVVTATTYQDTGLSPNTVYQYSVRALDNAANPSANTSIVTVTTSADAIAPSIPTGVAATANSSTQITITWNAATDTGGSGLAGYLVFRGGTQITGSIVSGLSFTDTGLAANTPYSYTVRAVDGAANQSGNSASANATTQPDITPPFNPSGLAGTPISQTQINLSWNPASDTGGSGFAGYRIYRNGALVATISGTTYNDTGLTLNTSYNYFVRSIDNAGNESGNSNAISVTTLNDGTAPTAPGNLTATAASSTVINLTWVASTDSGGSGLRGYRVSRGSTLLTPTPISATSFSDTGLNASTNYSYSVVAVDNAGNESTAATASTTTLTDNTPPTPPSTFTATATSSTQINLTWVASSDESGGSGLAGYHVYRDGVRIPSIVVTSTAYVDTGLAPNTSYSYTVRAVDNAGNVSADSNSASAQTQPGTQAPTTPSGLAGSAPSANQINLTWDASTDNSGTGLAGYRVFRNGALVATTPNNVTSYSDINLTPNTGYSYFVRAIDNANNQSANSNVVSVQTLPDTTAPTVPTSVSAVANSSIQITVTWAASTDVGGTGVNGYRVFRAGSLIGTTSAATLTWVDSPLAANTSYSYTVRAFDGVNNESADSAPASAQTLTDSAAPSVPGGLAATAASSQQINITWNPSTDTGGSGLRGYLVFRGATQLTPTPIAGASYSDTGLSPNTSYSYRVRAVDNAGNESADASVSGSTLADTTPPPAPSGLTANASSSTTVSLSWNSVNDLGGGTVAGYLVFRGGTQLTPSPIPATTFGDSGLSPNTNYSYTVRAVDSFNNTSANSNTASVTTLPDTTKPSTPGGLTASPTLTPSIQLSWSASTDTGGSGLALYVVYRDGAQLTTSLGTSYTDSAVAFNTSYAYSVTARDNAGNESDPSITVNASAQDNTAPTAPSGLSASATGTTSIALSWTSAADLGGSGIAGYRVYRGGSLLNPSSLITTTSYSDTGLTANTNYAYVVRAVDQAGNQSGDSNTASATTNSAAISGLDSRPSNTSCLAPDEPTSSASYAPQRVYPNRSFSGAIHALQAPGDSSRWYIAEQSGRVRWFDASDTSGSTINTFVDLTDRVQTGGEMGLLGMAFHPNFSSNNWVYISYTGAVTNGSGAVTESRVSRFTLSAPGVLNPSSEVVLLRIPQPFDNHNGGHIAFGPDGYLYFGVGDGGSGGDPNGNAQNKRTLLGKMLRIDVSPGTTYSIPAGNPFAGNPSCNNNPGNHGVGTANCPEIYALGLRNPWRWSFDRASSTPKLWLGDVGQGVAEEIDIISLGGNYGWKCREGLSSFSGCLPATGDPGFIDPVLDLGRTLGPAVTGGVVYRGTQLPGLVGSYLFADFYSFSLHRAILNVDGSYSRETLYNSGADNAASFTEDNAGEAYVVGYSGGLYKIVASSSSSNNTVPSDLAATGCVNPSNPQQPASGLIPYAPNAPFWSDNAVKERWLAIPDSSTITANGDGDWTFPVRTVLMKNFRLNGRIFETRLFMRHANTGNWRGYTYRWNDAQTAATLVNGGLTVNVEGQPWTYPSGTECLQCHTAAAGHSLGLETAQLNGNLTYPQTGRTANQLATLNAIGMIALPDPSTLPSYSDPYGSAALAGRARAYLHTNCAQCHRPGGGTGSNMDLRHDTAIASSNTCNVSPTRGDLGIANARLIAPGDPSRSIVLQRMNRRGTNQMPPIGSHLVDAPGAAVLSSWISSMNASCN